MRTGLFPRATLTLSPLGLQPQKPEEQGGWMHNDDGLPKTLGLEQKPVLGLRAPQHLPPSLSHSSSSYPLHPPPVLLRPSPAESRQHSTINPRLTFHRCAGAGQAALPLVPPLHLGPADRSLPRRSCHWPAEALACNSLCSRLPLLSSGPLPDSSSYSPHSYI